jgi:hypothetical protein
MVFELFLTFIVTLVFVGCISFVVNTFIPNRNINKSKHFRVLFTQTSVITLLLVFIF